MRILESEISFSPYFVLDFLQSSSSASSSSSQSPENKAAPPKENPWTKRQYNKETKPGRLEIRAYHIS